MVQKASKTQAKQAWIRVCIPPALTFQEVNHELEKELGHPLSKCSMERRGFTFQCDSREEQVELIRMDGAELYGHAIKILGTEYSMSGDDMMSFVQRLLESEEKLHLMRRCYGCVDDEPKSPHQVEANVFRAQHFDSAQVHSHPPSPGNSFQERSQKTCITCKKQGQPCDHDYHVCPQWKKYQASRAQHTKSSHLSHLDSAQGDVASPDYESE